MNALGQYRSNVTADWPIAASFDNLGQITYVAHNYTDEEMIVTFSDGYQLTVTAGEMSTNRGESITGTIQTDFNQAYIKVVLPLIFLQITIVFLVWSFMIIQILLESIKSAISITATNLGLGIQIFMQRYIQDQNLD